MATLLTWLNSGLLTSTAGASAAAFIQDVVSVFALNASNPDYKWQVAASNSATSPFWATIKRKDGSPGRILMLSFGANPASINPTIIDSTNLNTNIFICWFPNGNVDSPSNLTATSGVIMGNDSDATKASFFGNVSTLSVQNANSRHFYFESNEAIWYGVHNPSTQLTFICGAGAILVDLNGVAYNGVFGQQNDQVGNAASQFGNACQWTATAVSVGLPTAPGCVRTNYGSSNRAYFSLIGSPTWARSVLGPGDILSDQPNSRVYFSPIQLVGQVKGDGFPLRLRQVSLGPATTSAFQAYSTTGPVIAARQFNGNSTGNNATSGYGHPWMTNFDV
jgi:hypothetical protein